MKRGRLVVFLALVWGLLIPASLAQTGSGSASGSLLGRGRDYVHPYDNVEVLRITRMHAGRLRKILILKPVQPSFSKPPAILMLHHRGGNGAEMANLTQVGLVVRDTGTWVILPDAINGEWQHSPSKLPSRDQDLGFLDALIGNSISNYGLDSTRIHMAGYSLGGYMTIRFACDRADRIAGAFVVGATMINSLAQTCAPTRPVPFTFIHGTSDSVVPFKAVLGVLSAPQTAAKWAALNGCTYIFPELQVPDLIDDGARVRVQFYRDCLQQAAVDFFIVDNGGHTWPHASTSPRSLGLVSYDIHGTLGMQEFFRNFPPAPPPPPEPLPPPR